MLTKKAKLERFDTLRRQADLLQRYFWDSRDGLSPVAKVKYRTKDGDRFVAYLFGPERGDGGYVVVESNPGVPSITYYEEWEEKIHALPFVGEWSLAMKSLAEQLRHAYPVRVLTAEDVHPICLDGDGAVIA